MLLRDDADCLHNSLKTHLASAVMKIEYTKRAKGRGGARALIIKAKNRKTQIRVH